MPHLSETINSIKLMSLTPLKKALLETEYKHILQALEKTNFKRSLAAQILGIDRSTINKKIKQYKEMKSEEEKQISKESIPGTY